MTATLTAFEWTERMWRVTDVNNITIRRALNDDFGWVVIADLRTLFPAHDGPEATGNHAIGAEIAARVPDAAYDNDTGMTMAYGPLAVTGAVIDAIAEMVAEGWGAR